MMLTLTTVLDAFDLQQHVVGLTYNLGDIYTLDIVATFSGYTVDSRQSGCRSSRRDFRLQSHYVLYCSANSSLL